MRWEQIIAGLLAFAVVCVIVRAIAEHVSRT